MYPSGRQLNAAQRSPGTMGQQFEIVWIDAFTTTPLTEIGRITVAGAAVTVLRGTLTLDSLPNAT